MCLFHSFISSFGRLGGSKRERKKSIDWTVCSSMQLEAMTSDVIAPSPWKIFGCQNGKNSFCICFSRLTCVCSKFWLLIAGLRLFKEAKDWDSHGRVSCSFDSLIIDYFNWFICWKKCCSSQHWDDHPAIMAVGAIDGTSEAIFRTLMSLGPSRSEYDCWNVISTSHIEVLVSWKDSQ